MNRRDRWRLILGRGKSKNAETERVARALDELYGTGRGEGSESGLHGSDDPSFPTVREWAEELEALFGTRVREEVLADAAERGRLAALTEISPESVTPSVEMLERILSLKGGLPEAHLSRLRRLVDRIVEQLVRELAVRVRPAMVGLTVPRPTRRPGAPLHLQRTIEANLKTARIDDDGRVTIVPERLLFRSRAQRSMDWRMILVVDVSGSMEPSVIYSAMMAAIIASLPAVTVHFLAFSTEVVDLSERVDDPLGLLLEVSVGGGTNIAKALSYARTLVTVPRRTLLVLVSDFEEGGSREALLGEVRELAMSGVTPLGLAALDDLGEPRYATSIASRIVAAGMPVAALTPMELARWVGEQIR